MRMSLHIVKKPYKTIFLIVFVFINIVIFAEALTPATQSTETSMNLTNFFAAITELFSPNAAKVIQPESVSITGFETIIIGESKRLTASVLPEDTTDKAITWSSSNEDIAKVTSGGIVVAYDFGDATITATTSNSLVYSSIDVEVVDYPVPTSFEIAINHESIFVGTTSKISISNIEPAKASTSSITFSSNNLSVAQVNEYGVIKGIGEGTASISASYLSYSQTADITVSLGLEPINPTSLTINGEHQGYVYRDTQLTADFGSVIPTDQEITWLTNNPLIATVDSTGLVHGTKIPGNVIITAICDADDLIQTTFDMVISNIEPTALTLSASETSIIAGKTMTITPTFNPIDTTNREIVWTSSDDTVALVSSGGDYGKLVGLKAGTVTITAVSQMNENVTATISIEVLKPSTLDAGDRAQLNGFLRKVLGHFGLFFIDGLIGYFTFFLFFKKNDWTVLVTSGGIGVAVGILSEICQLFTEGRSCLVSDMLIDSVGYVAAIFILFFILRAVNRRKSLKNNSKVA